MVIINEVFHQLKDCPSRYVVCYGGRRSSKSWSISQLLVLKAVEHRGRRVVVLRKYATSIRLSTWARVQSAISEVIPLTFCDINKGERRITLPNGSEFIFVGADDPEKLKSIEAVTDYWLEEATEFSESDFNVLDAGLSTQCTPGPQMWFSFNPVPTIGSYEHWLQKRFLHIEHEMSVPRTVGNATVLRSWYQDNAYCPQATIDLLQSYRETNPALFAMWAKGEFTQLEGAILHNWGIVKSVPDYATFRGYSIDWGYAEDPAAVIAVWTYHNEAWIQQRIYQSGLTNPDLSEAMEAVGISKYSDIVADSSEPKSAEELRRDGWLVRGAKKGGRDYKKSAALYLQGLVLHVLEDSGDIQRELATWSWKQDKEGHVLPLVADGNDHAIDALIYRLYRPGGSIDFEDIERAKSDVEPLQPSIINDEIVSLRS